MFRDAPIDTELTSVPLFSGLSKRQLALVSRLSTEVTLPAGRVLAHEGAVGNEFFVVLEGDVEVVRGGELVATRGPGAPLGEIALLGNRPRNATLISQSPVRTLVANRQEFASLLREVPVIGRRLNATMTERLAA